MRCTAAFSAGKLATLDRVFAGRWFWSTRRAAPARCRRENHFGDPAVPLDECVRNLVEERTGTRPSGPVRLLTHLSYFGYCFNPLSLYYCFDRDGERVETVVAEVSNTPWGERHCYVLSEPMNPGEARARRYRTGKELHVSPFMDMDVQYEWLLTEPADDLVVRIDNSVDGARNFNATLVLQRREISGPALARVLAEYPLMSFKVIAAIHWQARHER